MTLNNDDKSVFLICLAILVVMLVFRSRRGRPSGTAFGTATWASDGVLRAAGMLAGEGLILGRTFGGKLIRLPRYCHVLLVGATGSGKGVSIIIPTLLSYFRGSLACFDTKGDLYETTAAQRLGMGQRIIRLAPFNGGLDALNPLDTIAIDSPMVVDHARAMAEALVVRQGSEPDPHWNDKSVQVICALLVLVLRMFREGERNLNAVQEIASDPDLLNAAADRLREMGGIPARLGKHIKGLFETGSTALTKEGAGVLSTVSRHLSFLDSDLVAKSVETSTFDPTELRKPGTTLFLQIPPDQLEAQKGLLRCWISSLVRVVSATGNEQDGEVLFLLDEASALGSLAAIEETLVRGRSAGVRMLLAYQSDSQVTAAFKGKPTLLYDNCTTQIYLGASSYETAERISKSLGDWTQVVESHGENASESRQGSQGGQTSRGTSQNYSQIGRALLRPEEVLTLDDGYLIAFLRSMSPILARRVKWYQDVEFDPETAKRSRQPSVLRVVLTGAIGLIVWVLNWRR